MDDFVQCWSNSRIKYFKIRHWNTTNRWRRSQFIHWINQLHFFDPLHSFRRKLWTNTYLGLEPYLPASQGCWRRELVKMKIRNLQSLLVCTIILWRVSSTEDNWIFGWRSRLASQILILFLRFTFLHCGWMERLLNGRIPLMQFLWIRCWWWRIWICKNVSRYTKYLAAHRCGSALQKNGLASFRNWTRWEWHWSTGNAGISTANWFSILKILRIVHTIYFILSSCIRPESSNIVFWSSTNFRGCNSVECRTLKLP